MLNLSEVLLQEHDLTSFEDLTAKVTERARAGGEVHFRIDVKPPFKDTPANWEDRLEAAFYQA